MADEQSGRNGRPNGSNGPKRKLNKKQIQRQRKLDARLHKKMDKRHKRKMEEWEQEKKRRRRSKKYRQTIAPSGRKGGTELSPELLARRERKRRKAKRTLLVVAMLFLLVVVGSSCYYLSQNMLVKAVEVKGESRYGAEELISATGIAVGNRLFYTPFHSGKKALLAQFPYLQDAKIWISFFSNKVIIKVVTEVPAYHLYTDGQFFVVSQTGKVLGIRDSYSAGFLTPTLIAGVYAPELGQPIKFLVAADEETRMALWKELEKNRMTEGALLINMQNTIDIEIFFKEQYKVLVGSTIDLSTKIKIAGEAIYQYLEEEKGIIDVRLSDTASFKPSKNIAFDYSTVAVAPVWEEDAKKSK